MNEVKDFDCMLLSCSIWVNLNSIVCLNVKELLSWSRWHIWTSSDCNRIQTHNNLVCKQTLNHLAKLSVCLQTKWLWVRIQLQSLKTLPCWLSKISNKYLRVQIHTNLVSNTMLSSPLQKKEICLIGLSLPQGKKVSLYPWLATLLVMVLQQKYLMGGWFITSTSLTPHLFLLGWLKLNLILFLDQLRLA